MAIRNGKKTAVLPGVRRFVLPVLLLCAFAAEIPAAQSAALKSYQKKISLNTSRADSLKQLIAAGEQRIRKLKADEHSTLRRLNEMEANMLLSKRLLDELTHQSLQVERDMLRARRAADSVSVQLVSRQKIMEERLRQIYKTGKISLPALLLGASSPTELLQRVQFAASLNSYDRSIMGKISSEKQRRNTELTLLQIQKEHFADLKKKKEAETSELAVQQDEHKKLIASIRSEKSQWTVQLEQLRAAERKLNALVDDLIRQRDASAAQAPRTPGTGFGRLKGQLLWPVSGTIISPYGKQTHPVYGTVITNKGIGISAVPGQSVRAAAAGTVEYTGKLPGYGKVLIINHSGGYMTIYAHLGSVHVPKGASVTAGLVVASVGESEGISAPQLHFEIRHKTDTENPLEWLK